MTLAILCALLATGAGGPASRYYWELIIPFGPFNRRFRRHADLRGAQEILSRAVAATGAEVGGSSEDGRFTLETLECQGACCEAPMMVVDGVYHENLEPAAVDEILGGLR